jgi:hypothetical protein
MAAPGSDITFYEKMTDIYEKISGVSRVVVGLLPGGRFQLTTASVRGHETTVFKQLPPSLGEFYKVWFKEFAKNEWIVYEDERYSFGDTLKIYEAMGAAFASEFNIKPGDRVHIKYLHACVHSHNCAYRMHLVMWHYHIHATIATSPLPPSVLPWIFTTPPLPLTLPPNHHCTRSFLI